MSTSNIEPRGAGESAGLTGELLELAKAAAAAGARILAGRNVEEFHAANKSSEGDWVTAFDLAAEEAVREVIIAARPQDHITGEELDARVASDGSGLRWSIDPLDGTTNFIRNIVYYCTSVAVMDDDGAWLAGVVAAPALGRTYWAARGQGAWLREGGKTRRLSGPPAGRHGKLMGTAFAYDPERRARQLQDFPALMNGFSDLRRIGSAALDLCMVADGTLDAYGERGLHEHDWAAGILIAEEAGAWVHRPQLTSVLEGGPTEEERMQAWVAASVPEAAGNFPV